MQRANTSLAKLARAIPFLKKARPLVTVLDLSGVIGAVGLRGKGLTLTKLESAIEAAFKPKPLAAVALAINSPGGSPVQSSLILRAVRRRAAERDVPVLAFIEDVGASGGYLLALAADEIYADASSIVGSIGVISSGFGFTEAIARLGVERRVYTAGESKSQLDPFRPENKDDLERLNAILRDTHKTFIETVRERRGEKLNAAADDLFTGAFWTAAPALERGLIDGIGQLGALLRTRFGEDVKLKRVSAKPSILRQALGGGLGAGPAAADRSLAVDATIDLDGALAALAERALWSRFGL